MARVALVVAFFPTCFVVLRERGNHVEGPKGAGMADNPYSFSAFVGKQDGSGAVTDQQDKRKHVALCES